MKVYEVRDFEKILKENGYKQTRQKGSHKIWDNGANVISVPATKIFPPIARRLIKENDLRI